MLDLLNAPGDGCSVSVPRRKARIFKHMNYIIQVRGRLVELDVVVSTRRRWDRDVTCGFYDVAEWNVLDAGPFVVATRLLC